MGSLKVIVDPAQRRTMIEEALDREAKKIGGHWLKDEDLINEVTFLVEYPDAALGNFNEKYLKLPACVLTTVMKHHQKYFACVDDAVSYTHLDVYKRQDKGFEKRIFSSEYRYRCHIFFLWNGRTGRSMGRNHYLSGKSKRIC